MLIPHWKTAIYVIRVNQKLGDFPLRIVDQSCCRINHQRSADDDENVGLFYKTSGLVHIIHIFTEPNDVRTQLGAIGGLVAYADGNIQRIFFYAIGIEAVA